VNATSGPGQSTTLLLSVLPTLRAQGIDYLIIGAFALAAHATVRATLDMDALLAVPPAVLRHLATIWKGQGFRVTLRVGEKTDPIPALLELRDEHGNRVDFLGGLRGLDPAAFTRAVDVPVFGQVLRVVGLEDFIAMKCFAGAPQDLLDAQAAMEACAGHLDGDLLRRLTRRFGMPAARALEHVLDRR